MSGKYRAVCRTDCQWRGRIWPAGTVYEGDARPPRHFFIEREPEPDAPTASEAEPEEAAKKTARKTTKQG